MAERATADRGRDGACLMRWFPLFLALRGRRVLVVGGGAIAERKIDLLLEAGPHLTVVAPELTDRLKARRAAGEITHVSRPFTAHDVAGARLVVAATGDTEVNRAVAAAAESHGILANVVDDSALSTATLGAIVDRSPIVIAISTEGSAPALARHIRARIETLVDESYGELGRFLARWRNRIKDVVTVVAERRRLYDALLDGAGDVASLVRRGRDAAADEAMTRLLGAGSSPGRGRVVLVGAGPGDPGLLTLNALRALQAADVVLHDRLVSPEILKLARREAELVEVGKSAGGHSVAQETIHRLLRDHAERGHCVVRLKGGDPFVFGRGGEELEYLRAAGIDYDVVPGITAAVGCAAYAGIPLTHRDHAESVRFVTAHCAASIPTHDWRRLAEPRETLAIYMGVGTLADVTRELLRHGRAASTPVAFVENGCRPEQRVVIATLATAVEVATGESIRSPSLLIVGGVAALGSTLHWYGAAPVDHRPAARSALVGVQAAVA